MVPAELVGINLERLFLSFEHEVLPPNVKGVQIQDV